jgi:hypothetical protein
MGMGQLLRGQLSVFIRVHLWLNSVMTVFIGIEMSRDLRLSAGKLVPPGNLTAGGVNLLRHALTLARRVTEPAFMRVLTIEPDETVLALVGEFECREGGVMQWMAELVEAAPNAAAEDAVIILRQTCPLRDEKPLRCALEALKKSRVVVSASGGEQVRAFEAWRLAEFGKFSFAGPIAEPPQLTLGSDEFVEISKPSDFERAGLMLAAAQS